MQRENLMRLDLEYTSGSSMVIKCKDAHAPIKIYRHISGYMDIFNAHKQVRFFTNVKRKLGVSRLYTTGSCLQLSNVKTHML